MYKTSELMLGSRVKVKVVIKVMKMARVSSQPAERRSKKFRRNRRNKMTQRKFPSKPA